MQPEELTLCSQCGIGLNEDEVCLMDDEIFCAECLDEETVVCRRCDTRIENDDNAGTDCIPLCRHCYDYHYTNCERCGSLIANEDAYYTEDDDSNETPYCYGCYESHSFIRSYSYNPTPYFHGEGNRYFGVELEIDDAGKDARKAEKLCNVANAQDDHIYIS